MFVYIATFCHILWQTKYMCQKHVLIYNYLTIMNTIMLKISSWIFTIKITYQNLQFLCDLCSKVCSSKDNLRLHKRLHDVKEFTCDEPGCETKIIGQLRMKKHKTGHLKVTCTDCGILIGKKNLSLHHKVCLAGQSLCCTKCDFKTKFRSSFKKHEASHRMKRLFH